MMCAARLAQKMQRVDETFVARQLALLQSLQLPTETPDFEGDQLVALMRRDKKVDDGELRFVLPTGMGHVELVKGVRIEDVLTALHA
jgi:3-dehydroquinate synthase